MLTALSRGSAGGGGATLREAILGRFAGGAGGAGLAFAAAAAAGPFAAGAGAAAGVGDGVGLATGGAGGGAGLDAGATCSSRYASGAQPCTEVVMFIHSHQPAWLAYVLLNVYSTYRFLPWKQSEQSPPPARTAHSTGRS